MVNVPPSKRPGRATIIDTEDAKVILSFQRIHLARSRVTCKVLGEARPPC